ncbi:MAG: hypothetical protein HRT69_12680 [Flavobacteriaceae bacterium]|nr:hypothetical protein [Flavobacteriaceae bacterium]
MKKNIFLLLLCLSTFIYAQKFNKAIDYLNFVGNENENISKQMLRYAQAVAHSKRGAAINSRRKKLIATVSKSISKIEKAKGYNDNTYKDQILSYMRLNESLLKEDYAKVIDMKKIAEQSYDLMEAYIMMQELTKQKQDEAFDKYKEYEAAFAKENNINLINSNSSELGRKMEITNAVFKHNNAANLTFFKANFQEITLIKSIEANDVNAIQQNANALSQYAKEGLEKLQTIELLKKDTSIIKSIEAVFNFYIDEAENKTPQLIEFMVLNESFDKIKTALEKTPERKRTKEQVDLFNKKVNEINKKAESYNKTNLSLNNNRSKFITAYNNTVSKFFERHIPKG